METRVAVISLIVTQPEAVEELNAILHTYSSYIIGRMGLPYRHGHGVGWKEGSARRCAVRGG